MTLDVLKNWYKEHASEIQKDFFTFLSFPSISTDPRHASDIQKTAIWLKEYLQKIGMEASVWQSPGHPAVFATHMKAGPSRPTVLIYNHFDVQPVDPLDLWHSPPFQPEVRGNQIYARGAVDNKGQCFYVIQALKALLELSQKLNINIKLFIEGEEESGGRGTAALLKEKQKELKADHLLVVDFDMPEANVPGITLGMRGILALNVLLKNAKTDLHSGMHGGIALNPNRALVQMLAQLWDAKGRVAIPGFYDVVKNLEPEGLAKLYTQFDRQKYQSDFGVKAFAMEEGFSAVESNWLRPSLEINGMSGGYTGEGVKTVIPKQAEAKITCRLVPDQDPDKVAASITQFLKAKAPQCVDLKIDYLQGAKPFRASFDAQVTKIAAKAFEEVLGGRARYQLCGASVPIVTDLVNASRAEAALIGVGLADDNIHAPNEHFGWDRFEQGFLIIGNILRQLEAS